MRIRIALAAAVVAIFISGIVNFALGATPASAQPLVARQKVVGFGYFFGKRGHRPHHENLVNGIMLALEESPRPTPPPPPITDWTSTDTADWQCIRVHESGDRYNSSLAPSGAYGIVSITWWSNGYSGWPYEASAAVQNALALKLYHEFGWRPWSTRFVCGLG
jgi:hypothetical protein